jgi:hypothetical protein
MELQLSALAGVETTITAYIYLEECQIMDLGWYLKDMPLYPFTIMKYMLQT